jgi:hypothetical protein
MDKIGRRRNMLIAAKKILLVAAIGTSLSLVALLVVTLSIGHHRQPGDDLAQEQNAHASFAQATPTTSDQLFVSSVPPSREWSEIRTPAWHQGCGGWKIFHCIYCYSIGYLKPGVGCPSFFNGYK